MTSALEPSIEGHTWRRVSPKLIVVELIRLYLGTLFVAGVLLAIWAYTENRWLLYAAAAVGAYGLLRTYFVIRMVRSYGYAERDRDLLVRHGRMVRHLSIIPYARMQYVDVTAGPMERAFGLATVRMHTAAAGSDATVPGLASAEATRLRDRLAALGEDAGEGL